MIIATSMKIRRYNDQHSTCIPVIPIVAGLHSTAQTLSIQPLKPVLLIVAKREKQLSLNTDSCRFLILTLFNAADDRQTLSRTLDRLVEECGLDPPTDSLLDMLVPLPKTA